MKVLFKSFCLYFLGIFADFERILLENTVSAYLKREKKLSSRRLIRLSDRASRANKIFLKKESELFFLIYAYKIKK